MGDAEFWDCEIHVAGDVFIAVRGFFPGGVLPGRVAQLLGAVDSCDVSEAGDAGCDDVEDGLAGGGPWVAASPYESFFCDREAGLCEVVPLFGCEGGGGALVALDVFGGEFGSDLVDSVEGSQAGELDEWDLASC